eukprot:3970402-Prymnesium_polylepis.2
MEVPRSATKRLRPSGLTATPSRGSKSTLLCARPARVVVTPLDTTTCAPSTHSSDGHVSSNLVPGPPLAAGTGEVGGNGQTEQTQGPPAAGRGDGATCSGRNRKRGNGETKSNGVCTT